MYLLDNDSLVTCILVHCMMYMYTCMELEVEGEMQLFVLFHYLRSMDIWQ